MARALIQDGDRITIDAETRRIDLDISDAELAQRRSEWVRPKSAVSGGALAKYRSEVLSASKGAVTVAPPWD